VLAEEVRGTGELARGGVGHAVGSIRETHEAIAARVFGYVGAVGVPVAVAHEAISELAYGSVRLTGRGLLRAAGYGAALTRPEEAASMERSVAGRIMKPGEGVSRGHAKACRLPARAV
jgi:hypothetical protein